MQCHDKQHSDYWSVSSGKIVCPLHLYDVATVCVMCYLEVKLDQVKNIVETLPEIGSPLYDDAVTEVFNAADDAHHLLEHEHEGK